MRAATEDGTSFGLTLRAISSLHRTGQKMYSTSYAASRLVDPFGADQTVPCVDYPIEKELTNHGEVPVGDDQTAAPVRTARDGFHRATIELNNAGQIPMPGPSIGCGHRLHDTLTQDLRE